MAESPAGVLPWQSADWESLRGRIGTGRLHHALLFSGPQGIGKRRLAEATARALLCSAGAEVPCGSCRSCLLLAAGTHPDSLRVVPEEPGRQIRISQVRDELIDFVMRTPSIAARKVVVIEPADAMNTPTANCLLKSLEEPAAGTHLLLVSDVPVRLLPTIRSRCEHLRLRPPAPAEALAWLAAHGAGAAAEDLLGAAAGCPLRALALAGEGGMEPFDRVADALLRALDPAAWVPSVVASLEPLELRAVLDWMQLVLGDLGRWQADPRAIRVGRARAVYEQLAGQVDAAHVARILRRVSAAAREAASTSNPNRQLCIESLLVGWGRRAV